MHFRRPGTAKNKPFAAENKLFSAVKLLFSAAHGRQKNLPKIRLYFRRLALWPSEITNFRRLESQPPKIKTCRK
jgi:hypothetical protein